MMLEHIVALGVRLFAIALAIYSIQNGITTAPYFYEQVGSLVQANIFSGLIVSQLIIAIGLWKSPLTVAHKIVTFRGSGENYLSGPFALQDHEG